MPRMGEALIIAGDWLTRIVAAFVVATGVAPFLKVGWWPVRLCDFPRLQLGVVALGGAALATGLALGPAGRAEHAALLCAMLVVAAWQISHAAPYSLLRPKTVPDCRRSRSSLRLAVLNLDFRNPRRADAARVITSLDADILVLIEIDEEWRRSLDALASDRRWREGRVLDDGLGLLVWSRVPLIEPTTEFLVTNDRPSVHAVIDWPGAGPVRFVALHPSPPGLERDDGERENSRKRDAELILVAKRVAERRDEAHIVAGDFNDVAWSHTTRLFQRLSGLRDPRVGRSLLSTYHARYPMLRYPIDHVFVSDGFRVAGLARVRIPGSDHLGIVADLDFTGHEGVEPDPVTADQGEAREIVHEGKQDARRDGDR